MPSVIGRRKFVLFDRPIAMSPCSGTASAVASEAMDSAIDAYTPPWTRPAGCLSSSRTGTRARTSVSEQLQQLEPVKAVEPTQHAVEVLRAGHRTGGRHPGATIA